MTYNPLEDLIAENNENGIRSYLSSHPNVVYEITSYEVSPLILSCYYKKPSLTLALKENMAKVNFFEACAIGDFETVNKLIEENSNLINQFYDNGYTGLGFAANFGHTSIVKFLLQQGANANLPSNNLYQVFPIHSAVIENHNLIIKLLLSHNAEVNVVQNSGLSPLHSAAKNGNITALILLLEAGANINIKTDTGKTPADFAIENGYKEIAEILTP